MQVEVRHAPAFAVARLILDRGEEVAVEAGAMVALDSNVRLRSRAQGGLIRSWLRSRLGGESFFVSFFRADEQPGWVDVAPLMPGDVSVVGVEESRDWIVQKGGWLAATSGVEMDPHWGGIKTLLGAEGLFLQRLSGSGLAVVSAYGAMDMWDLQPEETVRIGTEHMVAFESSMKIQLKTASGSIVQTMKSGERFVFEFTGPGRLLLQSRNPQEFAALVASVASIDSSNTPYRRVGGFGANQGWK
jgi:uncharacterized protein (TIGR00266 family)